MGIYNTSAQFGSVSKVLHWSIALMMISLIGIGWYMSGLSDENPLFWNLLDLHQLMGLSVMLLFFVKLLWMYRSPNPGFIRSLASWERWVAWFVHKLLIGAMLLLPVLGYFFATSEGDPVFPYELVEIPAMMELSESVADLVAMAHIYLAYACAALIVFHALAAFKHHLFDRDETLKRMLFLP